MDNKKAIDLYLFCSWSDSLSKRIAETFTKWIPNVIQSVQTYISSKDNHMGKRWNDEIVDKLKNSHFGVIFVTKSNQSSPWLYFEAGALSNHFATARVCPLLIDLEVKDIDFPLAQFQMAELNKGDLEELVLSIYDSLEGEVKLSKQLLLNAFEKWYPDFENDVHDILKEFNELNEQEEDNEEISITQIYDLIVSIKGAVNDNTNSLIRTEDAIYEIKKNEEKNIIDYNPGLSHIRLNQQPRLGFDSGKYGISASSPIGNSIVSSGVSSSPVYANNRYSSAIGTLNSVNYLCKSCQTRFLVPKSSLFTTSAFVKCPSCNSSFVTRTL